MATPVRTPEPPNASPLSPNGRRNPHSLDPKGRGRPRRITWDPTRRFNVNAKDITVESYGAQTYAVCVITHLPTGIVVKGHNDEYPGSILAAKKEAMFLLIEELEKLEQQ